MFCDELKIKVIAGKGGDGCISFRREKFIAKGGPNGGDGGRGGNVIFKVNHNLNTLGHMAGKKVYRAQKGHFGMGKNMHGKTGEDLIIEVPPGTIIFDIDKKEQLADLSKEGEQVIIAKGGIGGKGNARFASSIHQVPRFAETGEPGEEKELTIELKLVADVGIIGLPSAGKSTFISVISNARPKIAAYQFTTLVPNLGVVNMRKFGGSPNDSFLVADIPGLIEGASQGKGLGHQFLKHISRTKILVHLIDGTLPETGKNYKTVRNELKKFDKNLPNKEEIIVINKIDLLSDEDLQKITKDFKKSVKNKQFFQISAATTEGIKPVIFEIVQKLQKLKEEERNRKTEEKVEIPVYQPEEKSTNVRLEKVTGRKNSRTFVISGQRIEQLIKMTNISNPEGLERIYHYFGRMGINKLVEKQGATYGDYIKILDKKIPYRK